MSRLISLLLVAALAHGNAAGAEPPGIIVTNKTVFRMPVKFDAGGREQLKSIRLWTSTNCGKSWELSSEMRGDGQFFAFTAPRDGFYWFSVETVDKEGRALPADVKREPPNLRVMVRTSPDHRRIACSFDGRIMATSGKGKTIRLWDQATQKCVREFAGHEGPVLKLAFSPDNRFIASGGEDQTVRLWDVHSGEQVRKGKHLGMISGLAFSPDGRFLVSAGSFDATVKVWQVPAQGGSPIKSLAWKEHARLVHPALGFVGPPVQSANGMLLTSLARPSLRTWNLETGRSVALGPDERSDMASADVLSLAHDGRRMVSIHFDHPDAREKGKVQWRDLKTGEPWKTCELGVYIIAGAISPDARSVAIMSYDGKLRVWELATGKQRRQWEASEHALPTALTFTPDGRRLAGTGFEGGLSLWHVLPAPRSTDPEACWNMLAQEDAPAAFQAVADLVHMPEAAHFVARKLRPSAINDRQIERWIKDLSAQEFRVRQMAHTGLERAGPRARDLLKQSLANGLSLEAAKRVQRLIANWEKEPIARYQLRLVRAMEVLELVATPEAKKLLRELHTFD